MCDASAGVRRRSYVVVHVINTTLEQLDDAEEARHHPNKHRVLGLLRRAAALGSALR